MPAKRALCMDSSTAATKAAVVEKPYKILKGLSEVFIYALAGEAGTLLAAFWASSNGIRALPACDAAMLCTAILHDWDKERRGETLHVRWMACSGFA